MTSAASALLEGRFLLGERRGAGASSEVFRAVDMLTNETVAVKILIPNTEDPSAPARLLREAKLLSRLRSSRVVKYISHGKTQEGRPYLVLEWLEGEDLSERLRRQRPTPREALALARQAALSLEPLHALGVVHRDLKPANFFLAQDSEGKIQVKLLDLGIARAPGEPRLTQGGMRLGTPAYMAPEQARGEEPITTRTDIYALGVLLFELLTGRRPFIAGDAFALFAKILFETPPKLSEYWPSAPLSLEAIVSQAMARAPEDRFESVEAMVRAIDAVALVDELPSASEHWETSPQTRVVSAPLASKELRVVTLLFVALPEDPVGQHRAWTDFSSLAAEREARVERTLNGGAIALFGLAHARGDEAASAARLALRMVERYPTSRISLVTGHARDGAEGEALERAVLGLEGPSGQVRIDDATAGSLAWRFLMDATSKEGFRLLHGERSTLLARPPTVCGRATPTVGRELELRVLRETFDGCVRESSARVVLITAPAGGGKTRLAREFLLRLAIEHLEAELLLGQCEPTGAPLGPLSDALRRACDLLDANTPAEREQRFHKRMERVLGGKATKEQLAALASFAGVSGKDPGAERAFARVSGGAAAADADVARDALLAWLDGETLQHPLVFLLDDLHWANASTIAILDAALSMLRDRPLMLLALARPEVHLQHPHLWEQRALHSLSLGPLSRKACERLVREVLGAETSATMVADLVERSEGNPFFLEELLRAVGTTTSIRPATPASLLSAAQSRLDAAGEEGKRILRAASVFGRSFWLGAIAYVLELPELKKIVDRLVTLEVLVPQPRSQFAGETEYRFAHALVRDAAYASITEQDRKTLHRRSARWLQQVGGADPAFLAMHLQRAGESLEAAKTYLRAADEALRSNDCPAALECCAQARVALDALPPSTEVTMLRGEAFALEADAHAWAGRSDAALERARAAVEVLPRGSSLWFHALGRWLTAEGVLGARGEVRPLAELALEVPALDEPAVSARLDCLCRAAEQLLEGGELEWSAKLLHEARRIATAGNTEAGTLGRLCLVEAMHAEQSQDTNTRIAALQEAVKHYQTEGNTRQQARSRYELGRALLDQGELVGAEDSLRFALRTAERLGLGITAGWIREAFARVHRARKQFTTAIPFAQAAVEAGRAHQVPALQAASLVLLAELQSLTGSYEDAVRNARVVLGIQGARERDRERAETLLAQNGRGGGTVTPP